MENLTFYDHKPRALSLYEAVVEGMSRKDKSIPPKFFYDMRASELFDRICEQPEYYSHRVERRMLERLVDEIASLTGTGRVLSSYWITDPLMVQKLERVFSSRFTIVEIEHPPKAFATFYGIIG